MLSIKPARHERLHAEFDRQIQNLLHKGYPTIAGITPAAFLKQLAPLAELIDELAASEAGLGDGPIPFVIVVQRELVAADQAIALVERSGKSSVNVLDAAELRRFEPIPAVELPDAAAYLLVDVDTGSATRNITPDAALPLLEREQRSPLTLEEGIALVTHYPQQLNKNAGFSLLGSRCGDRRVTALWISAGQPKLGWCWAGNPHTWLGSASCARRIGP